jgi:copper chaperone
MTQTYRVGGMTCGGCVSAVTRAIRRLDPEAAVAVDLAAGKVSVGGALAKDAVQRAVEDAGFTFETG